MTVGQTTGGLVALVGAGAGHEQLATWEAISWITRADVVVYDRLACPDLVGLAPASAEKIYVGKSPGKSGPDQGQITEVLVRQARAGRLVVRLKGGDPLVFGRGGEEAEALAAAAVPYRIVPGVTAAAVAAAYAGIPLTDRRCASSVAFVTGRQDPGKGAAAADWQALAGIDTVVVYMGVGALGAVVSRLIGAGRDARTPAAAVASAGTARQRTITAPLAELPAAADQAGLAPPAVIIVGEVVKLREKTAWFEKLPLFGRTILTTRPAGRSAELRTRLAEHGAAVVEAPAIEIAEPKDHSAADEALGRAGRFDLVAFTSANGVEAFVRRCRRLGGDARMLAGANVAAEGAATADALRRHFIEPDIVPEHFTTAALAEAIVAAGDVSGKRILLARAEAAEPDLARRLRQAGARVEEAAFYRVVRAAALPPEAVVALREGQADWITFTSGSTVANFLALLAEAGLDAAGALGPQVRLAAIGPVTAEAIRSAGFSPAAVAEEHTADGLVKAILASPPAAGTPR